MSNNNITESNTDEINLRIDHLESSVKETRESIIEQEHRIIKTIINMVKAIKSGDHAERLAAAKAILYLFFPGRVAVIITGGTIIGLLTIILMQKNNELVASQNYYLQSQIYFQTINENRQMRESITKALYAKSPESIAANKAWRGKFTTIKLMNGIKFSSTKAPAPGDVGPQILPLHDEYVRTVALKGLVEITRDAPTEPTPLSMEPLRQLIPRWMCENLFLFCNKSITYTYDIPREISYPKLNLEYAFLNDVKWPNTKGIIVNAKGANLRGADLRGADLRGTNFERAILADANLQDANLSKANLTLTIFDRANLNGADLQNAKFLATRFQDSKIDFMKINCSDLENTDYIDKIEGALICKKKANSVGSALDSYKKYKESENSMIK